MDDWIAMLSALRAMEARSVVVGAHALAVHGGGLKVGNSAKTLTVQPPRTDNELDDKVVEVQRRVDFTRPAA